MLKGSLRPPMQQRGIVPMGALRGSDAVLDYRLKGIERPSCGPKMNSARSSARTVKSISERMLCGVPSLKTPLQIVNRYV